MRTSQRPQITSPNTKYTEVTAVLKELILRGSKRILDKISSEWKKYLNPVSVTSKTFFLTILLMPNCTKLKLRASPRSYESPEFKMIL